MSIVVGTNVKWVYNILLIFYLSSTTWTLHDNNLFYVIINDLW